MLLAKQIEEQKAHEAAEQKPHEATELRTVEVGGSRGSKSGIWGHSKGKALEKRVCRQCICKGIECKWEEGGKGESELLLLELLLTWTGTSYNIC